jgi:hypothetical protein
MWISSGPMWMTPECGEDRSEQRDHQPGILPTAALPCVLEGA